jgi:hypothetical protein
MEKEHPVAAPIDRETDFSAEDIGSRARLVPSMTIEASQRTAFPSMVSIKVAIRRPFRKLNLRHQLRLKPSTVLHLFSFVNAHIALFFSGRLAKGQASISKPLSFW